MIISLAELQLHTKIRQGHEDLAALMNELGCDKNKSLEAVTRGDESEVLRLVSEAFSRAGYEMQSISVEEATDEQLNWMLAICEGADFVSGPPCHFVWHGNPETRYSMLAPHYTTDPGAMVPIIEKMDLLIEKVDKETEPDDQRRWWCSAFSLQQDMNHPCGARAPTFLRAAALVRAQTLLGDQTHVPRKLWTPGQEERPRPRQRG